MHEQTHTHIHTYAHTYTSTHACIHIYTHAQTHTFIPTYALEAHLPKGMRIGQVKANNPRKICDAYVT